ncbi:MAG: SDR family oxidoreductase [Mariniphaga sp.]|nr:SDR family oxidoreductase [Mariniphaga sp.]
MNNLVIVVTGGAQGIGRKIATHFLTEKWKSVIWEIDRKAGDELANDLNHPDFLNLECNVAIEDEVKTAVRLTLERFGKIDVLVNNAAIMSNKPLSALSLADWQKVIDVNLTGPFLCTKYCEAELRRNKGSIINICSTRAFQSEINTEAYSASKGGVFALTHALAVSMGPEVRVNSISPGWIDQSEEQKSSSAKKEFFSEEDHKQHPAGRVGKTDDIARLAWFLSQPENSFITAQNFVIDGGMTRKMIYL